MKFLKNTIFICIGIVVLVACESDTRLTSSAQNKPLEFKKNIKQFTGKPATAVDMHYVVEKNIVAGEEAEIDITLINKKDVDDLLVRFKFDSGLLSNNHTRQYNFGILSSEQESVIRLRVTAENNGLYYIYLTATLVTDNQQSRSFAIPVNVGNVDVQKSIQTMGSVITDSAGRRIITMPAQMK